MKSEITSEKIQFHLTRDDFEASLSHAFNVIFVGSSIIGMLLFCCYLIISEWSSTIYNLNIFLLLLSPILWIGTGIIYEGIFPFIGELIITINYENLFITRKIFILSGDKVFSIEDIVEIGQWYFGGFEEYEDGPAMIFRKCFIKTNHKQIFFGDYIKQEYKDIIIEEINKFVFKGEKFDNNSSFDMED